MNSKINLSEMFYVLFVSVFVWLIVGLILEWLFSGIVSDYFNLAWLMVVGGVFLALAMIRSANDCENREKTVK